MDTTSLVDAPEHVGEVTQKTAERRFVLDGSEPATLTTLAARLRAAAEVAPETPTGHPQWVPTEATFASYAGNDAGITPHRDGKRHRLLIAIITLYGRAPFRVVADRAGSEVLDEWVTEPGDLVLLRAPGLGGHDDGRPLHAVGPPEDGSRLSLTFRMNSRIDEEG